MTGLLARAVQLIPTAPPDIDPSTGKGPEWGKAAPIGLLVILLLCISMFFLMRSMNRKIKAIPTSFDPPAITPTEGTPEAPPPESAPTDAGGTRPDAEPGAPDLVNE